MGVRRAGEQNIRTISKNTSGTYSISLPIQMIRELGWQEGQKVVVDRKSQKLIIEDWKK